MTERRIRLTNHPVSEAVRRGDYLSGLRAFESISVPDGIDLRLHGQCLWGLGRYQAAEIELERAVVGGEIGALVDLASLAQLQRDGVSFELRLAGLVGVELLPGDRVRADLMLGDAALDRHELGDALRFLTRARIEAMRQQNPQLIHATTRSLALTHSARGADRLAAELLHALLGRPRPFATLPMAEVYNRYTLALLQLRLGEDARAKVELANEPPAEFLRLYGEQIALMLQALGDPVGARLRAQSAVSQARQANCADVEIGLEQLLLQLSLAAGDVLAARRHWQRLEALPHNRVQSLVTRLRGAGLLGALERFAALEAVKAEFATLGRLRERAQTALALAHAAHVLGRDPQPFLDEVEGLKYACANPALVRFELPFDSSHPRPSQLCSPQPAMPLRYELLTFGVPQMRADSKPVSQRLSKGLELLAYLQIRGPATLETLVEVVFGGTEFRSKAAANYFHQARKRIAQFWPGLSVTYQPASKTYQLECETLSFDSDYTRVTALLHAGSENDFQRALDLYSGPFLPLCSELWAEEVRGDMEWLLMQTGMKVLQGYLEAGELAKSLALARRLKSVDCVDESLNLILLQLTAVVEGGVAAHRTSEQIKREFIEMIGEVPPNVERARQALLLN